MVFRNIFIKLLGGVFLNANNVFQRSLAILADLLRLII